MFRGVVFCLLVGCGALAFGQDTGSASNQSSTAPPSSTSSSASSSSSSPSDKQGSKPTKPKAPDLTPPRSDRVNAGDLGDDAGESSSKDTKIDLSAPADDAKAHPESSDVLKDVAGTGSGADGGSVGEFHAWDPHKAAKAVEVGDFYFKVKKNYRAAESRYREALSYKDNDAVATFRLAVCLEKLERPQDARAEYESYLRILPHGPEAEEARKAVERLKSTAASAKPGK